MNILLTNDDGIQAEGIRRLAGALGEIGRVYVYAPAEQKSACGHGITLNRAIQVSPADFPGLSHAMAVSGTPADCVKIGVRLLRAEGIAIDRIYSGVNHGWNLGTDTLYSGTVSAAIEGVLAGIPSVALSVASAEAPHHFEAACALAVKIGRLPPGAQGPRTALNVNTPDLPLEEIKGLRFTKLGLLEYEERFDIKAADGAGRAYKYAGKPAPMKDLEEDLDINAHRAGYATITPLRYDLTDLAALGEIKNWGLDAKFEAAKGAE
jgi:5'-nucleotidase